MANVSAAASPRSGEKPTRLLTNLVLAFKHETPRAIDLVAFADRNAAFIPPKQTIVRNLHASWVVVAEATALGQRQRQLMPSSSNTPHALSL
jgi:hypothetical protein